MYFDISYNFRTQINEYDNFLIAYSEYKNMPIWDCLCAGMDWIQLACENIDSLKIYEENKDENIMAMNVYKYISCIDIILEAITQINKVLNFQVNKPLKKRFDIFADNKYNLNDRDYFKMVRAVFGAHSVKLTFNHKFSFDNGYFASWPAFENNAEYDAYVYLYGQKCKTNYQTFGFKFESLRLFLEALLEMLDPIINHIKKLQNKFVLKMQKNKIILTNDSIKDIEVLSEESRRRGFKTYFDGYLHKLKNIYTICEMTELEAIKEYKTVLDGVKNEIIDQLQNMDVKEIQNDCALYPQSDDQWVMYNYQNLNENIFSGLPKPYSKEIIIKYINDVMNFPERCTENEFYCLVLIGLYRKHQKYIEERL